MASVEAATQMWSRTGLTPRDLDVAELYDGFTFLTIAWLQALGVCGDGEGGTHVHGRRRPWSPRAAAPSPDACCSPADGPSRVGQGERQIVDDLTSDPGCAATDTATTSTCSQPRYNTGVTR
jgi:hypothetical protein